MLKQIISKICILTLVVVFLCPAEVFATEYRSYLAEKDTEQLLKYVEVDENGLLRFDKVTAVSDNVSADIIAGGEKLEELAEAYKMYATAQKQGIELYATVPIYGNYCGPGTETNVGDPVDYLDAKCQEHDDCYDRTGYYACTCDTILVNVIDAKYSLMTGEQKIAAIGIRAYFKLAIDNPSEYGASPLDGKMPSCALKPQKK